MRYIYIVNTCDNWKSYASMEKQIVTTSWIKAYKTVLKLIAKNKFKVGNRRMILECKYNPYDVQPINNSVDNIYVEIWED